MEGRTDRRTAGQTDGWTEGWTQSISRFTSGGPVVNDKRNSLKKWLFMSIMIRIYYAPIYDSGRVYGGRRVDRLRHRVTKRGDSIPIIGYQPTNSLPGTIIFESEFTQERSVSKEQLIPGSCYKCTNGTNQLSMLFDMFPSKCVSQHGQEVACNQCQGCCPSGWR